MTRKQLENELHPCQKAASSHTLYRHTHASSVSMARSSHEGGTKQPEVWLLQGSSIKFCRKTRGLVIESIFEIYLSDRHFLVMFQTIPHFFASLFVNRWRNKIIFVLLLPVNKPILKHEERIDTDTTEGRSLDKHNEPRVQQHGGHV